jgi:hypothetical protein
VLPIVTTNGSGRKSSRASRPSKPFSPSDTMRKKHVLPDSPMQEPEPAVMPLPPSSSLPLVEQPKKPTQPHRKLHLEREVDKKVQQPNDAQNSVDEPVLQQPRQSPPHLPSKKRKVNPEWLEPEILKKKRPGRPNSRRVSPPAILRVFVSGGTNSTRGLNGVYVCSNMDQTKRPQFIKQGSFFATV